MPWEVIGMRLGRFGVLLLTTALVTACGGAPATDRPDPASLAPSGTGAEPSRSPSGSQGDAEADARAVLEATSDAARRDAILDVFAAVGIGVYDAEGEAIVPGEERHIDDFWAYDFEIDALVDAINDDDRRWLSDLAGNLQAVGLIPDDQEPFPVVAEAISQGVRDALAEPDDPASYPLLVATHLAAGVDGGPDLAALDGSADVALDLLSTFLVAADFALPSIAATPVQTADLRTAAAAPAGVLLAAGPCAPMSNPQGQAGWHAGRGAARLPGGGTSVNAASSPFLQAMLVNGIVEWNRQFIKQGVGGHYRHDPADTARDGMVIEVRIRINAPAGPILCGQLRGAQIPPSGPIVGLPMNWQDADVRRHATVECPAATCQVTGPDGKATWKYLTKLERDPRGIGPVESEYAWVRARGDVVGFLAPAISQVTGALTPGVAMAQTFEWHRPYKVTLEVESDLYIVEALQLYGHVADAYAQGVLEITGATQPAAGSRPPCTQPPCVHLLPFAFGDLNVLTLPATDGPQCPKQHATIAGPSAEIDMTVVGAVIYPAAEIRVQLDSGPFEELLDIITFVPCGRAPNQVSEPGTSAWEHYIMRSRSGSGLVFEGLKAGTGRSPGWDYIADRTPDVWKMGGVIAIWDAPEGCGGSCTANKSYIKLVLKVEPLPMP